MKNRFAYLWPALLVTLACSAQPARETPGRGNARATMETFLVSVNQRDLREAVACMDFSGRDVPVREREEMAMRLKHVIDRIEYVDYTRISDDPDGEPYVFHRLPEGEVVIARNAQDEWLFSAETIDSLPHLVGRLGEADVVPALWLRSKMPASLTHVSFLLEHWQWLGIALLVFLGVLLDKLVTATLGWVVGRWLRQNLIAIKTDILQGALRPLGLLAMALVWWGGLLGLALDPRQLLFLVVAIKFVAAAAIVWSSYRMVDVFAAALSRQATKTDTRMDDLLVPLLRKSAKVFIAAFGLVFIADNLNVDITSLLAGLGLGGVALALASQDTIKNLFGSMTVLLDRPFHVGDWVVVHGVEGTVEEVGFRSTRIRTFYDSLVTLPNSTLISASVDNYGERKYRRWSTRLDIACDTHAEKIDALCEAIRELVRRHPYTRKDYYHVYLNEFGASSLEILLYVFFTAPDWSTELRERHRLAVDILRVAARLDVELALPTQTVYLRRPATGAAQDAASAALGYAETVDHVVEAGRSEARSLVESALQGAVPPPVKIEVPGPEGEPR